MVQLSLLPITILPEITWGRKLINLNQITPHTLRSQLNNNFVKLLICILALAGCAGDKRTQTESTIDSVEVNPEPAAEQSSDENAEELEDFNNSDNGAPGIADTKKSIADLDSNIQEFLNNIRNKNIAAVIDSGFIILNPGPGVQPQVLFSDSREDFSSVNKTWIFFKDSSIVNRETPVFTWPFDRCNFEDLPNGIYLNTSYIDPLDETLVNESQLQALRNFNDRISNLEYRYGNDFNFKFTADDGTDDYLTLRTFLKNGKLFLLMIDNRDCGV
jgi:hypothetical protein